VAFSQVRRSSRLLFVATKRSLSFSLPLTSDESNPKIAEEFLFVTSSESKLVPLDRESFSPLSSLVLLSSVSPLSSALLSETGRVTLYLGQSVFDWCLFSCTHDWLPTSPIRFVYPAKRAVRLERLSKTSLLTYESAILANRRY